eukprot:2395090-Prorocentrum_lima.AAC.1
MAPIEPTHARDHMGQASVRVLRVKGRRHLEHLLWVVEDDASGRHIRRAIAVSYTHLRAHETRRHL